MPARPAGDAPGPIDNLQDLQDTGKFLFKAVDANNDGRLSRKEVTHAGDMVIGGFFFTADTNGDGVVSEDEMKQARDDMYRQRPLLRLVIERAKSEAVDQQRSTATTSAAHSQNIGANPFEGLMAMIDSNQDRKIEAGEVRQTIKTTVNGIFNIADTDRDDQLSPSEINAASVGLTRAVAQSVFQTIDGDGNGAVSKAEFDKAVVTGANMAFSVVDANNDGQITPQEANTALRATVDQVRQLNVPEPANSARNLLQSGRTPGEVAPVPRINLPTPGQSNPSGSVNQPR
jgi:Ca2+-binding EF-hand superfamily protein